MFDTIAGLPMHPLIVHAAVVLSPLSALLLIGVVLLRRLRSYATLALVGVLVGTAAVIAAKFSGEAFEKRVGDPGQHAQFGNLAMLWSIVFAILTAAWWILQRRATPAGRVGPEGAPSRAATGTGLLAAVAAVAMIVLVVLTGHSGAERVWGGVVAASDPSTTDASETAAATSTATTSPSETASAAASSTSDAASSTSDTAATGGAVGSYTAAQVADHAQRSDCWASIEGSVYDLTSWIGQHPGGADRILALCGTDATSAFEAQHGGQTRPASELASFKIGSLS